MREVARRDVGDAAAETLRRACDELAHAVVLERGEAGDAHADHAVRRGLGSCGAELLVGLMEEVERDEHAPVEVALALSGSPGGEALLSGEPTELGDELLVVGDARAVRGIAELGERPPGTGAGGYVQVVEVHRRVRARDHDGLRLELGYATRGLAVRVHGRLDLALPAVTDAGDYEGRVRNCDGNDNGHAAPSRRVTMGR